MAARSAKPEAPAGAVLLATKLHVPEQRHGRVSRPELLERLSEGLDRKLTLVDAPAGWGKTTLLAEWCAADRERVTFAWLSLDVDDNDPVRFWTYVIEALRRAGLAVGEAMLAQLQTRGVAIVERALPTLLNELAELPSPAVLVLDDYHLIGNREIREGVTFLVEHLPPMLHLVLGTRADPALPLSRLRVQGELTEIRMSDLRFREQETAALVNGPLGLGLSQEDVALLQQRTEGWVAGLHLAALSLQGRVDAHEFIAAFAGDDRHIVDYLGAEVLDRQSDEVRSFVLRTSILDRLFGPLCDAVTDRTGSAKLLSSIEGSNLFLVALDTRREWFRYHRLFGELLRHELEQREPGATALLHRRAADWHREQGLIPEAIHHALAAGDLVEAGELVAQHWTGLFNQGRHATVSGWLDTLGDGTVRADGRLCVAQAWIALDERRLDDVDRWTRAAEEDLGSLGRAGSLAAATAVLRLVHRFKIGHLAQASEAAENAAALVDPADQPFEAAVSRLLDGVTRYWRGEQREAEPALAEAAAIAQESDNKLGAIYALGYLAFVLARQGELERAEVLAGRADELADDPGRAEHFVAMMPNLARGEIVRRRGQPGEAEPFCTRAVELSLRGAGLLEVAAAYLALAHAREGGGDARGARDAVAGAREAIDRCPDPGVLRDLVRRAERAIQGVRGPRAVVAGLRGDDLSARELAVLRLLPTELSQREIGQILYLSLNTVKTHARNIFRKLGVSTRAEAVARARDLGLL